MIGWVVGDGGVLMAARHAMAGAFRQRGTGRVANPTDDRAKRSVPSFCTHCSTVALDRGRI